MHKGGFMSKKILIGGVQEEHPQQPDLRLDETSKYNV